VLGAAAVVTLAGCKDPDYKRAVTPSQAEVKSVETTAAQTQVQTQTPVANAEMLAPAPAPICQCPPGTKHDAPCRCGSPDCKCVVETKTVPLAAVPVSAAGTEYTVYVVQEGDFLSKISKRYNVTLSSIRRLNPSIKNDVIRVGQKIKLPGKIDVGVQTAPAKASAAKTAPGKAAKKSGSAAYTGATKEYVVKNGDTLGSVAYGNGINIRQLKQLNGLTSDSLKIGQKLKVPAEKVVAASGTKAKKAAAPADAAKKADAAKAEASAAPAGDAAKADAPAAAAADAADAAAPATPAADAAAAAPAPAAPATSTYVVQEGDDMTGVSIRWGVSAAVIRELNNLGENDQLVTGQVLKLPAEAQQ